MLILVLHGSNQTGPKVRAFSGYTLDRLAVGHRAAVVYPDAYKGSWNDARSTMKSRARAEGVDDVHFITAVIDDLQAGYAKLPVFAVGYSNGGHMVIRLVHEVPDRLTGAVLIGATQPTPDVLSVVDRHQPMAVMLIHGTRDPIAPYAGGVTSLWGFRPRGTGLSAPDSARYFADRNSITTAPTTEKLDHRRESANTSVTVQRWRQEGHLGVTLYTVENGGHVIPNPARKPLFIFGRSTRDLDAGQAVSDFVDEQPGGA